MEDHCAIQTIYAEARGESHLGRVAVGEVILNRMAALWRSDGTVCSTVHSPDQFATSDVMPGDPGYAEAQIAWEVAKKTGDFTLGATHFYNPKYANPVWAKSMKLTRTLGQHRFLAWDGYRK